MNYRSLTEMQRREIEVLRYQHYKHHQKTDIEILEKMDFAVVERFVREKKLKNIKK